MIERNLDASRVYCYAPHTREVLDLFRLVHAVTLVHSCSFATQIPEKGRPLFAYAAASAHPVPQAFWDRLATIGATYLRVSDAP